MAQNRWDHILPLPNEYLNKKEKANPVLPEDPFGHCIPLFWQNVLIWFMSPKRTGLLKKSKRRILPHLLVVFFQEWEETMQGQISKSSIFSENAWIFNVLPKDHALKFIMAMLDFSFICISYNKI